MKLAILGSGGHARSVAGVAVEELKLPVIAFIDVHSTENSSEKIYDLPVVSGAENIEITLQKLGVQGLILAVGDNQERDMLYTNLKGKYQFPNVISNSAILKKNVALGEANVILCMAYVGPYSVIGNNNIINTRSIVEHECKIGSSNHIAPNSTLLGRVVLGNMNFIGSGATLSPKVSIGSQITIGALSFVNESLTTSGTYVGAPAKLKPGNSK